MTSWVIPYCPRFNLVLVANRNPVGKTPCWGLFGGRSDKGEEPRDCAKREIREEAQIDVGEGLRFTHQINNMYYYVFETKELTVPVLDNKEHYQYKWVPAREAKRLSMHNAMKVYWKNLRGDTPYVRRHQKEDKIKGHSVSFKPIYHGNTKTLIMRIRDKPVTECVLNRGRLLHIETLPEHRGKGYAKMLLANVCKIDQPHLVQIAHRNDSTMSDGQMIMLFERYGFQFRSGGTQIIMERT